MKKLVIVLVLAVVGALLWLVMQGEEEVEAFAGANGFEDDDFEDSDEDAV